VILCGLMIREMKSGGVCAEQLAMTDQSQATEFERMVAGICDIALKEALEFVGRQGETSQMIEGKNIEEFVRVKLNREHLVSFHDQLKKLGFEVPPQR